MAIPDPPIPEGSVVNGQILITSYFDTDGRMKYFVGNDGELNLAQALGLLVLSGISLFRMYEATVDYDADEIEEDEDDDDESLA